MSFKGGLYSAMYFGITLGGKQSAFTRHFVDEVVNGHSPLTVNLTCMPCSLLKLPSNNDSLGNDMPCDMSLLDSCISEL